MTTFEWIVAGWVAFYFVLMWGLIGGLLRLKRSVPLAQADSPPVTVLVSARNEERDLPGCLESLARLDYPAGKLDIVLVNDQSDDRTGALMEAFAAAHAHVTVLHTRDLPPNGLEAKARGIAHGFTRCTGEWVFITDADARVHPAWVRNTLGRVDGRIGMAGGSLVIAADSWIGIIERTSWAFVQMFNLGMAGWGFPFVCLGPNMAMRRDIYVKAGGLENADFHVAEDLALFKMVINQGYRIQCYMDEETTATLKPVPTFRHLFSQQRRWFGGGIQQGWDYFIILMASFWWGFGLLLFILLGWLLHPGLWALVVVGKALTEGVILVLQRRRMNLPHHLRYLWVMELYHIFVFLVLPASFLFTRKVKWMGDGYSVQYD